VDGGGKPLGIIVISFGLLAILTHPVAIILLGGICCILLAYLKDIRQRKLVIYLISLPILYVIFKIFFVGPEQSENKIVLDLFNNLNGLNGNNPLIYFFMHHISHFSFQYLPWLFLTLLFITFLIIQRQYRILIIITLLVVVVFTVHGIIMRKGESGLVLEKALLPIGFAVLMAIPFVWKPTSNKRNVLLLMVFIPLVFMKFREIGKQNNTYKKRLQYLSSINMISTSDKIIIPQTGVNMDIVKISWNTGIETLLYSVANFNKTQTVFILPKFQKPEETWFTDSTLFLGPQFSPTIYNAEINEKLFKIKGFCYEYYQEKF
jgi:hypothetical protein